MRSSFEDLFELYARSSSLTKSSAYTYRFGIGSLRDYLARSDKDLLDADRHDLSRWVSSIRRRHSSATVCNYVSAVKGFYSWCEGEFDMQNPADDLELPVACRAAKSAPPLSPSKLDIVLASARKRAERSKAGMRDLAILRLMMLCCVRSGEIVRANACDFNVEGGMGVFAIRAYDGGRISAAIPLDEETTCAVLAHLSNRDITSDEDPLFAAVSGVNAGGRMHYRSVNRVLREALASVGETPSSVSLVRTALTAAAVDKDAGKGRISRVEAMESVIALRDEAERPVSVDALEATTATTVVTAGELRRMTDDFAGDDEVVVAIDGRGRISIAPHIDALPSAL